jgi:hypothetical protein
VRSVLLQILRINCKTLLNSSALVDSVVWNFEEREFKFWRSLIKISRLLNLPGTKRAYLDCARSPVSIASTADMQKRELFVYLTNLGESDSCEQESYSRPLDSGRRECLETY